MKYDFDLKQWLDLIAPLSRSQPKRMAMLEVYLGYLQEIHNEFMTERALVIKLAKYSFRTKVLTSLLNQIFDPTLKRIRIATSQDNMPVEYDWLLEDDPGDEDIQYDWLLSDNPDDSDIRFTGLINEFTTTTDFIVYAPISLSSQEEQIKSWINLYRHTGVTFKVEYI